MVDGRLTYGLGRDRSGRYVQLVLDGADFVLKRGAGANTPAAEIALTADQMKDIIHLVGQQ